MGEDGYLGTHPGTGAPPPSAPPLLEPPPISFGFTTRTRNSLDASSCPRSCDAGVALGTAEPPAPAAAPGAKLARGPAPPLI